MFEQFRTYKVQLKVVSSVVTPFHADTIFGTICWGIALLEGQDKIRDFLSLYKNKGTVPLIVSDGLFDGYLPRPILEPLSLKNSEDLIKGIVGENNPAKTIDYIQRLKRIKNIKHLSIEYYQKNQGSYSQLTLSRDYLNGQIKELKFTEDAYILRTSMDRYSGKAMEGRLFPTDETFYNSKINIYIKLRDVSNLDGNWLKKIFNYIEISGYGADKSMGKGQVKVESIEEKDDLPHCKNPNAFVSLSSFVPDENDPSDGWYTPILKYGKLGEHYASASTENINSETHEKIGKNPFKRPLLMFCAGSTFRLKNTEEMLPHYGRIVENIHWDTDIVHYGLAFPLGIRLE
ncbi:MAG: hypothetical protein A2Y11_05360 [Planctomycetes bacterium GWC2_39_26]|nr:MAG: hypothetical protein A2Y11_05360 [Planctomycetes bacterium GWC2_39_26]